MAAQRSRSRLALPFFLNLFFTVFEIVGGFFTNSVAILSDAVHDLGDSLAIGLSWFLDLKAKKKPDARFTFGYGRYALLGGLISSLILVAGAVVMIFEAVPRLIDPEPVDAGWMILFAVVGILVNGLAALNAAKGHSVNEKAVSLHLFEDVFGWVAVLLGAGAMYLWDIPILDALLSLLFTTYILFHVFKNIREILAVFLEQAPAGVPVAAVEKAVGDDAEVRGVHHVHVWSVDGAHPLATLHAVVRNDLEAAALEAVRDRIRDRLAAIGVAHATIEIEREGTVCDDPACDPGEPTAAGHHHHH